jgi:hypothetical protein
MALIDGSGRRITGNTAEVMERLMRERYKAHIAAVKKKEIKRTVRIPNRGFFRVSDMDALHNKWNAIIDKMMIVR